MASTSSSPTPHAPGTLLVLSLPHHRRKACARAGMLMMHKAPEQPLWAPGQQPFSSLPPSPAPATKPLTPRVEISQLPPASTSSQDSKRKEWLRALEPAGLCWLWPQKVPFLTGPVGPGRTLPEPQLLAERDSACDHLPTTRGSLPQHPLSTPLSSLPVTERYLPNCFSNRNTNCWASPLPPHPPTLRPMDKTTGSHWMGCGCLFNTRFCSSLCSQPVEREELCVDSTPLLGPGFFAFPSQWKLTRGQIRNSGKGLLGSCCVCVCGGVEVWENRRQVS